MLKHVTVWEILLSKKQLKHISRNLADSGKLRSQLSFFNAPCLKVGQSCAVGPTPIPDTLPLRPMQWPRDKLNVGVAEFTIEAWLRCTLYVNICRIDVVDQMTLHVHIYAHIIQNIYSYTVIHIYLLHTIIWIHKWILVGKGNQLLRNYDQTGWRICRDHHPWRDASVAPWFHVSCNVGATERDVILVL